MDHPQPHLPYLFPQFQPFHYWLLQSYRAPTGYSLSCTRSAITMLGNGVWRGWHSWIPCCFILHACLMVGFSSNFTLATQLTGTIMRLTNNTGSSFITLKISRLPTQRPTLIWCVHRRHLRATHLATNYCLSENGLISVTWIRTFTGLLNLPPL